MSSWLSQLDWLVRKPVVKFVKDFCSLENDCSVSCLNLWRNVNFAFTAQWKCWREQNLKISTYYRVLWRTILKARMIVGRLVCLSPSTLLFGFILHSAPQSWKNVQNFSGLLSGGGMIGCVIHASPNLYRTKIEPRVSVPSTEVSFQTACSEF